MIHGTAVNGIHGRSKVRNPCRQGKTGPVDLLLTLGNAPGVAGKHVSGAGGGVRTRGFWAHFSRSPDYEFRPLSLAGALPAEPPRLEQTDLSARKKSPYNSLAKFQVESV